MKGKFIFTLFITMLIVFGISTTGEATLIDRGGGLIYDTDLDITWLQNGNYYGSTMSWTNALAQVASLEYYDPVRDVYWDDWRLPSAFNWDGSGPNNPCDGYDCTKSELGHLFYEEMGNIAPFDGGTIGDNCGLILDNVDPFFNVVAGTYWFDIVGDNDPWFFNMRTGYQGYGDCTYAWPVRDGDVPEPATVVLLGAGVLGLAGLRRKKR